MPPRRRDKQTPDPLEDREVSRERGRQVPNPEVERDLHDMHAKLMDMEIIQRRTTDVGDFSESENEDEAGHGEEEVTVEDATNERLLRVVARMSAKPRWTFQFMREI